MAESNELFGKAAGEEAAQATAATSGTGLLPYQ